MIKMISIYEAYCDQCGFKMALLNESILQYHAEQHMMETGHTVNIKRID